MAGEEKTEEILPEKTPEKSAESGQKREEAPPKKGGWFQKIPKDILFSPGGLILVFFAVIIEIIDLIPIPVLDQIIEIPLELIFLFFLVIIAKTPVKGLVVPFIIERIPLISDILPTWLLRLLM